MTAGREPKADSPANVHARLQRLESWVDFISQHGARPPIFLARRGATDVQWKEQAIHTSGGVAGVVDFDDGRDCTSDADTAAILDLGDSVVLMEVLEGNATRYVKIREEGAGQYYGMVLYTDAQNQRAWGYLPIVNTLPV